MAFIQALFFVLTIISLVAGIGETIFFGDFMPLAGAGGWFLLFLVATVLERRKQGRQQQVFN